MGLAKNYTLLLLIPTYRSDGAYWKSYRSCYQALVANISPQWGLLEIILSVLPTYRPDGTYWKLYFLYYQALVANISPRWGFISIKTFFFFSIPPISPKFVGFKEANSLKRFKIVQK